MEYAIRYTDPAKMPIVIKPYTINGWASPIDPSQGFYPGANAADTSLIIMGRGSFDYGEPIQTNLLRMLENFCNSTPPLDPKEGQLWFDSDNLQLNYYANNIWEPIAQTSGIQPTADINMSGFKIINMGAPTNPYDATTKEYVDNNFVELAGDTMTGRLSLNVGYTLRPGSSSFVENNATTTFQNGSTLAFVLGANINVGTNRIQEVGTPMQTGDAVNKQYVDGRFITKTGDVVPGPIEFNGGVIISDNSVITIDSGSSIQFVSGSTITFSSGSNIDMGNNFINQVANPLLPQQAATKNYVDVNFVPTGVVSSGPTIISGDIVFTGNVNLSNPIGLSLNMGFY